MSQESWRKSSYSGGGGGNCVEVGNAESGVAVRDTKNKGTGAELRFSADVWRRLTDALKQR